MIKSTIVESISQGFVKIVSQGFWNEVRTRNGDVALRAFQVGEKITLRCQPELMSLRFLRHAWSGVVEVEWLNQSVSFDLYADLEDTEFLVYLSGERSSYFDVTITVNSAQKKENDLTEVWLLGVEFARLPKPQSQSMLINERIRLLHANWGDYVVLANDRVIPSAIIADGAWAPNDILVFEEYVKPGDFVIDIGANFGHHSVVFSKLVGKEGLVLAVEAQRTMFQLLNANAVLNGCANLVPLHLAAGAEPGEVTLYPISYSNEENFGALGVNFEDPSLWQDRGGELVKLLPMDEVINSYAGKKELSFVKIDVQAFELFVLKGMKDSISIYKPTIFTEISPYWMKKAGYDYKEIYNFLYDLGYRFKHSVPFDVDDRNIPMVPDGTDIEWDLLALHAG